MTKKRQPGPDVAPPSQLRGARVSLDQGELAILSFPVPENEEPLTSAEREVVSLILAGKSNADIARERGTSVRTVANQVQAIFRKLGVHSRAQLVAHCALVPRK